MTATTGSGWWRLNLGDASLAGPALDALCAQLRPLSRGAGAAPAYARHESEGRLHCELVVYLAPAAAALATTLGAAPCAAPAPGDLTPLPPDTVP